MVEKSRITINPEICGGKPVITNTRVLVSEILEWIEQGHTFDEITHAFPSITVQDVQAAISYARMVIEGEKIEFYSSDEIST